MKAILNGIDLGLKTGVIRGLAKTADHNSVLFVTYLLWQLSEIYLENPESDIFSGASPAVQESLLYFVTQMAFKQTTSLLEHIALYLEVKGRLTSPGIFKTIAKGCDFASYCWPSFFRSTHVGIFGGIVCKSTQIFTQNVLTRTVNSFKEASSEEVELDAQFSAKSAHI